MEKQEYQGYTGVWRRMKSGAAVFIRDGEDIKTAIRRNFSGDKATQKLREYDKKDYAAFEREQQSRSELNKALREKGELSEDYENALKRMKQAKAEQNKIYNEKHDYINEMQDLARKQEQGIKIKKDQFDRLKEVGNVKKNQAEYEDSYLKMVNYNSHGNEEEHFANSERYNAVEKKYRGLYGQEASDKIREQAFEKYRKELQAKQMTPKQKAQAINDANADDGVYEYKDSYRSYKDKFDDLRHSRSAWTGKEYTNDEFMEHLTDANWHTERRMLEDAKLTNKQLGYIKDNTELYEWSADLDKKSVERLIGEAKEKYPTKANSYKGLTDKQVEAKNKKLESQIPADYKEASLRGKSKEEIYGANDVDFSKMTRKQLAEYIVDDQIRRGVITSDKKDMQVEARLNGTGLLKRMSKQDLVKGAKDTFDKKDAEIENSVHSLFVYKNEKGMGSGEAEPLKRYYDIYGKENVDRVWKKMEDKYEVIEGTSMDSEGLRYNNIIEKSKYNPEAIQAYKNRMNTIYDKYGYNSREYNAAAKMAADEFERTGKAKKDVNNMSRAELVEAAYNQTKQIDNLRGYDSGLRKEHLERFSEETLRRIYLENKQNFKL